MLRTTPNFQPLQPEDLVALATDLQREPNRSQAIARLGSARVKRPDSPALFADSLVERTGPNLVEAFLEHPPLAAGWFPLSEEVYPWKLVAKHIPLTTHGTAEALFRLWHAEYHGPLGTVRLEIRPTSQIAFQLYADVTELERELELARTALSKPQYAGGLHQVLVRIAPRSDLSLQERQESPSPYYAEILLPGDSRGANTAASLLHAFFKFPAPSEVRAPLDGIHWHLESPTAQPMLLRLASEQ